jgi:hypothetical protein
LNPLKTFGDLYEIRSAPNEIFVNAATVSDIEVIEALTQSNIRSQTAVSGLYPGAIAQGSAGRVSGSSQSGITNTAQTSGGSGGGSSGGSGGGY